MLQGMANVEDELRGAIAAVALGQPVNAALERDVGMAVRSVLARHGLSGAQVSVRREGRTLAIDVIPPPGPPLIQRISLRMG